MRARDLKQAVRRGAVVLAGTTLAFYACAAAAVSVAVAPATGTYLATTAGGGLQAEIEVRGHLSYATSQGQGGTYYYWPTHTDNDCGNSYCSGGRVGYQRYACKAGTGLGSDNVDCEFYGDCRLFKGSTAMTPLNPQLYIMNYDGEVSEDPWYAGSGFTTNLTVQFKVGAWPSDDEENWTAVTASPGL